MNGGQSQSDRVLLDKVRRSMLEIQTGPLRPVTGLNRYFSDDQFRADCQATDARNHELSMAAMDRGIARWRERQAIEHHKQLSEQG